MVLIIAANIDCLGAAADDLSSTAGGLGRTAAPPSLGELAADSALLEFSAAVTAHAGRLSAAAEAGSRSLRGYVTAFGRVGG